MPSSQRSAQRGGQQGFGTWTLLDFEVLVERKRRALRAHLGVDVAAHLRTLQAAFISALRSRATSRPDGAGLSRT